MSSKAMSLRTKTAVRLTEDTCHPHRAAHSRTGVVEGMLLKTHFLKWWTVPSGGFDTTMSKVHSRSPRRGTGQLWLIKFLVVFSGGPDLKQQQKSLCSRSWEVEPHHHHHYTSV